MKTIKRAGMIGVLACMAIHASLSFAQTPSSGDPEGKTAITVNGETVRHSEVFDRLLRIRAQDFIVSLAPPSFKQDSAGHLAVSAIINERLILQWATKTNQLPTDSEVNAEFDKIKTQPGVLQGIEKKLFTEADAKYEIKWQRARFNLATTAVSLNPGDGETFYKAHLANFTAPERWTVSALRTTKEADLPKLKEAIKAGKPFLEILKTYNEDAGLKDREGEFGVLTGNDPNIPPQIREAIKAMKIGDLSSPIRVDVNAAPGRPKSVNWFVFQLTRYDPKKVQSLSEVKEQCERLALLERAGGIQVADKKITDYRAQSKISIDLPGFDDLLPPKKP